MMVIVTFALYVITSILLLCMGYGAQSEWSWVLSTALFPLCLLLCWRKPTLKSAQNIFSIVFALAFATILLFVANSFIAITAFFGENDQYFYIVFVLTLILGGWLLGKFVKQHYLLFVVGVVFSVTYCCIPQNTAVLSATSFALVTLSACCILASAIALNKRLAVVSDCISVKNVAPYLLLRNLAFTATAVVLFVVLTVKYLSAEAMRISTLASNIVGVILLCVLTFTYLRQPLDYVAEKKLKYLQEQRQDVDADAVKNQLKERLSNLQNYPLAMWLKKILGVVTRVEVVGLEKVTETATCFVANHYEIYGPYITTLKFPKLFMPWTEWAMTDKHSIAKQLRRGIDNLSGRFIAAPVRKKIPQMVARPLYKIVQFARPIPVFHHGAENFEKMLADSATALNVGDSIMVFPEKPPNDQNYKIGGVDKLHTGFVEMALAYKKLTGQELSFYPLYIDKFGKQMIVGDKVSFNYDAPLHEEKARVADELYDKLDSMYRKCENKNKKR